MSDVDVIEDQIDEEFQSHEIASEDYARNMSNQQQPLHRHCSVSQARLSKWTWLIGSPNNTIKPLMCVTPMRADCHFDEKPEEMLVMSLLILMYCLFALANLISLAVWLRRKAPTQGNAEASIQLLLLRVFSGLGLVYSISSAGLLWLLIQSSFRVISVLQAALLIQFFNVVFCAVPFCFFLLASFNFLTGIFLVEYSHPAQKVLLFCSLTRAKIAILVSFLVGIGFESLFFMLHGFVYCETSTASYVLMNSFARLPRRLLIGYRITSETMLAVLWALTIILIIVFGCKRCCSSCRGSPSEQLTGFDSSAVAYSRHVDETDNEDSETANNVVIESMPSGPNGCQLENELRRLLVWHQVLVPVGVGLIVSCIVIIKIILDTGGHVSITAIHISTHLIMQMLFLSSLLVLSPLLSPTFRSGVQSAFFEVKQLFQSSICCIWVRNSLRKRDAALLN